MALRYRYAGVFTLTTFTIILNEELCSAETFQPEQDRSYQCPTFFLTSCIFQSLQVAAPIWHWQQYRADGIHKCLPFFHRKNRWCFCHFSNTVCTALEKLLYAAMTFSALLAAAKSAIWLIITYLSHYCYAKRCIQKGVLAADAVAFNQRNILLYNKLHTSNTNKCPAKRVEKHISRRKICAWRR